MLTPLPEAWWSSFGAKRVARVLCLVAMRASRHGHRHVSRIPHSEVYLVICHDLGIVFSNLCICALWNADLIFEKKRRHGDQ